MIKLDLNRVNDLFTTATHQAAVLVELHKMVFPEWDKLDRIDGHPGVNEDTWEILTAKFVEFDHLHHPSELAGSLWLIYGFVVLPDESELCDWEVSMEEVELKYKSK